jgi:hypothetical protein
VAFSLQIPGGKRGELVAAWLEELDLMPRFKDDATASERALMLKRAARAVSRVETAFRAMRGTTDWSDLTARWRASNEVRAAKGGKKCPWSQFEHQEKLKMVRATAQVQVLRARRGLEI